MRFIKFTLRGTSHISVHRFSEKARKQIQATQEAGSTSRSKKKREPKDFHAEFVAAQYRTKDGWRGIHAAALRHGMIGACRLVNFKMVMAKLALFVEPDGYDELDGTPLVRIWGPDPEMWIAPVNNDGGGKDLRSRPRWSPGEWELRPCVRYDASIFTESDVANLIQRVGAQLGVCEGRPCSPDSPGLDYGLFDLVSTEVGRAAA